MSGTVVVVDDDQSVGKALSRLLQVKGYGARVFRSAEECLPSLETVRGPACVIADLVLPGISGSELQARLPFNIPFIMLTGDADVPTTVSTMLAGAIELLEKPVAEAPLLAAVERALAVSAQRNIERDIKSALSQKASRLTPRELEVMAMVTTGLRNKEVANFLGIVEKTVKVHRANIMHKLEIDSLAEMVRCADRLEIRYTHQEASPPRKRSEPCQHGFSAD
ncbi:response regulator transcription factor [Cupriavidus taiwanensis]|uniref:response regulator transcription factor n=1 Tax=Cupriavidus taiwanensis TaxID=164546 RepID=UPI000E120B31|nr:LuxR C-terminal-related transcriptional regulator [Cupriavidus taiwanensis]SOY64542.1 putative response regulator [Cupriavidus taiwanensis]